MHTFELTTIIDTTIEEAFDLARDVDAHVRSQENANERAVAGVTSGMLELGDEVTWKATHFGIPFRMTSRIVELDRPNHFVDAQVKGPFRSIRHTHRFAEVDGAVRMVDQVEFTSPLGPVGRFVDAVFLGRYMERLIAERNEVLKTELEQR